MAILVMVVGLRTFLPKNALVLIYVWNFSTDPSPPVYGTKSVHSVRWGWCPRPRRFGRFLLAPALGVSSTMFQTFPLRPPPSRDIFGLQYVVIWGSPISLFVCPFIFLSLCLSLCLSIFLSVCLFVSMNMKMLG